MIVFLKVLQAAGLAAGLGAADLDTNQPPGGGGDRKGGPPAADRRGGPDRVPEQPRGGPDRPQPGEPRGGPDRGNRGENRGPQDRPEGRPGEHKADPGVQAWVNSLVEKMTDPHDTIRDSARAGLVAVGHAAVPTLKKLADDGEGAKAVAARKVLEAIAQHHQRPTPAGFPGRAGPSGPPMGFGTAGGGFGLLSQFLGGGGAPQPGGGPRPETGPMGGGMRGGMNSGGLGGGARPEGGPMGGGRRPEAGPPSGPAGGGGRPGPGGLPGRGGPGGEGGRPETPPRPPIEDNK